jgi:DTW domain-containing protein YfiP
MSGCWCSKITPQRTRARFILLQHPREARNSLGTARMAHLALDGSTLLVGVDFMKCPEFPLLLESERERSVVVFPSEGAGDARELAHREATPTIWLIDGTWWQAKKIWRSNPALRQMPAYRIDPRQPSQYGFRSEPEPHCISTIEAVAELLEILDGGQQGTYESFLSPFRALVQRQLTHAQGPDRRPRWRTRVKEPKRFTLPEPLQEHPERAVLFFAEGNGWPSSMDPRPKAEVLQALAVRPATGERVGAFVRPRAGLSPTALENQGLRLEELAGWIEPDQMAERWRRFCRPDDVWCGWGRFSPATLSAAGVEAPLVVDLREVCKLLLRAKVGRVENAHRSMKLPARTAVFPGRGGLRLAMLEAIWSALAGEAGKGATG